MPGQMRLQLIGMFLKLLCFVCFNAMTTTPRVTLDPLLPVLTVNATGVILKETQIRSVTDLLEIKCIPTSGIHTNVNLASISPSGPCGGCFILLPCAQGTNFCLMYAAGQGTLNAAVGPRYQLTFNCSDSDGRWVTTNADVFIQPNSLPYFDPATYPGLKVEGEIGQSQGFTVLATDLESDALTYSMVTYPDTNALEIDRLTGEIGVAQGKSLKSECRNHYAARVFVKDSHHSQTVGPLAVSLDVSNGDQNQHPVITNLKGELRVREDEAVDSVVLAMGVMDEGNDVRADTMTYTMTTEPHSAASLFKLVENVRILELQVESALDYETQPHTIVLEITANDGFCDSETYDLTVRLVDVNEPPVLEPASQTLESCEGKNNPYNYDVSIMTYATHSDSAVNFLQVDITPLWRAGDQDKDDVIRFTKIIPNEKGAFALDPKTGVISTVVDYGIDDDDAFIGKETVLSTVTVTDSRGETAIAGVTVRFVDCNDNPPVFPQGRAKRIELRDCMTSSGTVAGKVDDARDADSAYNQNNVFSYSGVGDGAKVESSGAIVLTRALTGGEVITFPVLATDRGMVPGPLSSQPYYVSISVLECIPSEPLTPEPYTPQPQPQPQPCQSNTEGLKFTAIALVAILVAAVLMTLICRKQRRPTRPTRQTRPTRPTVYHLNVMTRQGPQGPPTSSGPSSDHKPRKQKLPVAVPAARGKTWYSSE